MTFPIQLPPGRKPGRIAIEAPPPEQLDDDELGWLQALRAIRRRLRMIVLVTLGICLAALPFILRMEKIYYAEARGMFSMAPATALAESATIRLGEVDITGEIERLGSSENAEAVIARFGLDQREEFNPDLRPKPLLQRLMAWFVPAQPVPETDDAARAEAAARVLAEYRSALKLRQQGTTNVVTIGFTSRDRELAAQVPAAVIEVYRAQTEARWRDEIARAANWLEGRVLAARGHVRQSRAALEDADAGAVKATADTVIEAQNRVSRLEANGARLAQELSDIETTLASIAAAQGNSSQLALSEPEVLANLRRELLRETRVLENAAVTFGEKSDVVTRGRARVAVIRDDIRTELAAYRQRLELRQKLLTAQAEDVQRRVELAGEQLESRQRAALERDRLAQVLRTQEQSLSELEYRHQTLVSEGRMTPTALDVLSPALVPRFPLGAGRKVYLLAVILCGALAALTLAGVLELLDKSVRSHEQLAQLRALVPVGYLPAQGEADKAAPAWPPAPDFGESLSRAVLMIQSANHGEFPASMLVFPATGGGGAAQSAHWIALDLHASGYKVLLVTVEDGAAGHRAGAGELSLEDVRSDDPDGIGRLTLDAGLGQGERFREQLTTFLIDAACAGYVTIFDSLPLDRLITLKIAQLTEARLLVMRWGRTPRPAAELIAHLSAKAGIAPLTSLIVEVNPQQHSKYGFTDFITLTASARRAGAS